MRGFFFLILMIVMLPALAENDGEAEAVEGAEDTLSPKVTIIEDERGVIEEYRLNGQLYMIRVTPKKGKPYYLVDADGDGQLESRRSDLDPDVMVPSWTLFRW